jgi:hypothetical protein
MFTARAATSSTVAADRADSRPIIAFARRDSGNCVGRAERNPVRQGDVDVIPNLRTPVPGGELRIIVLRKREVGCRPGRGAKPSCWSAGFKLPEREPENDDSAAQSRGAGEQYSPPLSSELFAVTRPATRSASAVKFPNTRRPRSSRAAFRDRTSPLPR